MSQTKSKVKDPVCGMIIDAASAVAVQEWQGAVYHFCSSSCATTFNGNPHGHAPSRDRERRA